MSGGFRRWLILAAVAVGLGGGGAATGETEVERLGRVLQIEEVVAVLRDEGLAHGRDLDAEMLGDGGGEWWLRQVGRIHDRDRMQAVLLRAFETGMTAAAITDSIAFFDTEPGQAILSMETAARRAIADPAVEEIARAAYEQLRDDPDARFRTVARFIQVNDLVERNVAGLMTSSYQFYRGLADGGLADVGEDEMLADVWSDEAETRADTEAWLFGFLLMAYRPIDDETLDAYVAFSGTAAGRSLNAALFDGFDTIYSEIAYALGRSLARALSTSDL